jgi:hypothetical protein
MIHSSLCPPVFHFLSVCIFSPYYIQPAIFNGYSSPDPVLHNWLSFVLQMFYNHACCLQSCLHSVILYFQYVHRLPSVTLMSPAKSAHRPTCSQHTDLRPVSTQTCVVSKHTYVQSAHRSTSTVRTQTCVQPANTPTCSQQTDLRPQSEHRPAYSQQTHLRAVRKHIYVQSAHRPAYSQQTHLRAVSKQIYVHSQNTDLSSTVSKQIRSLCSAFCNDGEARAGCPRNRGSITSRGFFFFFFPNDKTGSTAQPASYLMNVRNHSTGRPAGHTLISAAETKNA